MKHVTNYQPSSNLLQARIILVTGAGDGIGACAAKTFATHGATVILLGRTTAKLERVYDHISEANHPQPAIYPMDLQGASVQDYADLASTLKQEFGHLDGLLHNASILGSMIPIAEYPPDLWAKVLQINLNAPFLLTRACLPLLKGSQDASIVFTSSGVGKTSRAYWGAYAVSKAGIENLMQTLADELGVNTHVRVNSINPGPTRTAMRARAYPAENPSTLLTPEEIMEIYLYLLGPDSASINGQQFEAQT